MVTDRKFPYLLYCWFPVSCLVPCCFCHEFQATRDCPLSGLCRRCKQHRHMARQCIQGILSPAANLSSVDDGSSYAPAYSKKAYPHQPGEKVVLLYGDVEVVAQAVLLLSPRRPFPVPVDPLLHVPAPIQSSPAVVATLSPDDGDAPVSVPGDYVPVDSMSPVLPITTNLALKFHVKVSASKALSSVLRDSSVSLNVCASDYQGWSFPEQDFDHFNVLKVPSLIMW